MMPLPTDDPLAGRLAVTPADACRALSIGHSRLYELINDDELDAYHEGRGRRITVESIRAYRQRRLDAARAKNGDRPGGGNPGTPKSP